MLLFDISYPAYHSQNGARIGSAKLGPQYSKQINLVAVPPGEYRSGYESPVPPLRHIDCVWLIRD